MRYFIYLNTVENVEIKFSADDYLPVAELKYRSVATWLGFR